jgi:hypothetical protein
VARSDVVERPLHDVRIWRPLPGRRTLALAGRTTAYSFSPVDEFVIGTSYDAPLVVRRQRDRHTFLPGESCVWDPEHVHRGTAPAAAWSAELVVVPEGELVEALDAEVALACRPGAITSEGGRRAGGTRSAPMSSAGRRRQIRDGYLRSHPRCGLRLVVLAPRDPEAAGAGP